MSQEASGQCTHSLPFPHVQELEVAHRVPELVTGDSAANIGVKDFIQSHLAASLYLLRYSVSRIIIFRRSSSVVLQNYFVPVFKHQCQLLSGEDYIATKS